MTYKARPVQHRAERTAFGEQVAPALWRALQAATAPLSAADLGRAALGRTPEPWERFVVEQLLERHGAHRADGAVVATRLGRRSEWGYCLRAVYDGLVAAGRIGRREVETVQTLREYLT